MFKEMRRVCLENNDYNRGERAGLQLLANLPNSKQAKKHKSKLEADFEKRCKLFKLEFECRKTWRDGDEDTHIDDLLRLTEIDEGTRKFREVSVPIKNSPKLILLRLRALQKKRSQTFTTDFKKILQIYATRVA